MSENTFRILFLGDIMGRPGREVVESKLPSLRNRYKPTFIIANGENAAAGSGITPAIAEQFFSLGIHAITLGNHAFRKREIYEYLDQDKPIVRPGNLPDGTPGSGVCTIQVNGIRLVVINISGRVYMDGYDDPFAGINRVLKDVDSPHIFVDFHGEATSEKVAFGFHVDGRVSAVVGTHTHVQTADEQVLPGGTAYITDAGMCGPQPSVIGMDKDIILRKFRSSMPTRFEVADEPGVISGVVIDVERDTGRATSIERVSTKD